MLDKIKQLIENTTPSHYGRVLKAHPDLGKWLLDEQPHSRSISEALYCCMNPDSNPMCSEGNLKSFRSFTVGYQTGCGNACPDSKKAKTTAIEKTNMERYGVTSTLQLQSVIEKSKKTMVERYGVEKPAQRPENRALLAKAAASSDRIAAIKKSNMEKYGVVSTSQLPDVKARQIATLKAKHGVELREKGIASIMKRYNSTDIQNKIKETNIERYGVDHFSKKEFSAETMEILVSKEKLEALLQSSSANGVAKQLGVSRTTVYRYIKKYDITPHTSKFKSFHEEELSKFLDTNNVKHTISDRSIISPSEVDFYIPEHKLAIEYHGLYWHSARNNRDANYHLEKRNKCNSVGVQLIQIFADEYDTKPEAVQHMILSLCREPESICGDVKEIDHAKAAEFHSKYSIKSDIGSVHYGLISDGNVVAVMSFDEDVYEIVQYSSIKPFVGVGERLLSYAVDKHKISHVIGIEDMRWPTGLFDALGFSISKVIEPDHTYSKTFTNRLQKSTVIPNGIDNEAEMAEKGYYRIYDAGKLVFEKTY